MFKVDIPSAYKDKIWQAYTQPATFLGNKGVALPAAVEGKQVTLNRLKGRVDRNSCLVLQDPQTQAWYKVSTPDETRLLEAEKQGQVASLQLNQLQQLAQSIEILNIYLLERQLPALRSPHLGVSIHALAHEHHHDREFRQWLAWLLTTAYWQAIDLLNRFDIWFDDANLGNILLRPSEDGQTAHLVLIDYAGYKRHPQQRQKDEQILQELFDIYRRRLEDGVSRL